MRFWDSSAVLPLLAEESSSDDMAALFDRDPRMVVWWATEVECASALARRERADRVDVGSSLSRLAALSGAWHEVEPSGRLRATARRLLRVHPLRAADALQLAAAIVAANGAPESLPFLTLDRRLADAAEREGFPIVRPA